MLTFTKIRLTNLSLRCRTRTSILIDSDIFPHKKQSHDKSSGLPTRLSRVRKYRLESDSSRFRVESGILTTLGFESVDSSPGMLKTDLIPPTRVRLESVLRTRVRLESDSSPAGSGLGLYIGAHVHIQPSRGPETTETQKNQRVGCEGDRTGDCEISGPTLYPTGQRGSFCPGGQETGFLSDSNRTRPTRVGLESDSSRQREFLNRVGGLESCHDENDLSRWTRVRVMTELI